MLQSMVDGSPMNPYDVFSEITTPEMAAKIKKFSEFHHEYKDFGTDEIVEKFFQLDQAKAAQR